MISKAIHAFSYGVYVVSTWDKGRPVGCVANSAMQITSSPATVAVSINHDNYTNRCIRESGRFAVTILGESCDPSLIGTFGYRSSETEDKFAGFGMSVQEYLPIPGGGIASLTCKVIDQMETATHTVFLGEVTSQAVTDPDGKPMTYEYYRNVIKGKSPKNAPTYEPELVEEKPAPEPQVKYVCSVCGYVYNGEIPFEELPEDFVCPICRQPKSVFKKQTV